MLSKTEIENELTKYLDQYGLIVYNSKKEQFEFEILLDIRELLLEIVENKVSGK